MRAELSPAEEAAHLARRKELFEARRSEESVPTLGRGNKAFAQDTSDRTGQDKSGINKKIKRAEALGEDTLQDIKGNSLDKATEMDAS